MPLTEEQKSAARARYAERCKDPAFLELMRLQARERYYQRRLRDEADGIPRKPVGRPRKYAPFADPVPYSCDKHLKPSAQPPPTLAP